MSTTSSASIEATREALRKHGEARLLTRAWRRLMGSYPTAEAIEALRRHDLTPAARTIENILSAIDWTRRLNSTPAAKLGGRFATTIPDSRLDRTLATVAVPFNHELRMLTKDALGMSELPFGDSVGLWADQYSRLDTPRHAAPKVTSIGVVVMNRGELAYSAVFTPDRINGLWPESQQALEALAETVQGFALHSYMAHRPELTD